MIRTNEQVAADKRTENLTKAQRLLRDVAASIAPPRVRKNDKRTKDVIAAAALLDQAKQLIETADFLLDPDPERILEL